MRVLILSAGLGLLLAGCASNDSTSATPERVSGSLTAALPKTVVKDSPEALMARIGEALESDDIDVKLALWDWEGVTNREQLEPAFLEVMETCDRVSGIVPAADPKPAFVRNGIRYSPNRAIEGKIELLCDNSGAVRTSSVPFGSKDGGYALVNVTQERTGYEGPDDVTLNVTVMGVSTPGGNQFEGNCDYIVSGEPRQLTFQGDGNRTLVIWGTGFERCEVRRLHGSGWVQLKLSVAGEDVYESEKTELNEPLTYSSGA